MALSMEELRGKPAVGPLGAACVVGLAIGEVGGLIDEPSTGFGFTGWWKFPVPFGALMRSGLELSSSGLEGLDESEKNVVCPAEDGVVLPRDRVSMGGGRF